MATSSAFISDTFSGQNFNSIVYFPGENTYCDMMLSKVANVT